MLWLTLALCSSSQELQLGLNVAFSNFRFLNGNCIQTYFSKNRFLSCVQPLHTANRFLVFLSLPWVCWSKNQFLCLIWPTSCSSLISRILSFRSIPLIFVFPTRTFSWMTGGSSWCSGFTDDFDFSAQRSACSSCAQCRLFIPSVSQFRLLIYDFTGLRTDCGSLSRSNIWLSSFRSNSFFGWWVSQVFNFTSTIDRCV